jgi:hypothetical protein
MYVKNTILGKTIYTPQTNMKTQCTENFAGRRRGVNFCFEKKEFFPHSDVLESRIFL